MKTNLITDPITGEILHYDKLFLGQRQVVTPEELKNYNYAPMSGVVKGLDGTLVDITKIYQTFGEAKTEGGTGEVPAHNHDSVYSRLEHTHAEYVTTEDVYTKEEVDKLLECAGGGATGETFGTVAGSLLPPPYAVAPANPYTEEETTFIMRGKDKDGNLFIAYSKSTYDKYPSILFNTANAHQTIYIGLSATDVSLYTYRDKTWVKDSTTYAYTTKEANTKDIYTSTKPIPYHANSNNGLAGQTWVNIKTVEEKELISDFNLATDKSKFRVIVSGDVANAPTQECKGTLNVSNFGEEIYQNLQTLNNKTFTRARENGIWTDWMEK